MQQSLLRSEDVESGGSYSVSTDGDSGSRKAAVKDALWGSNARKAVTACSTVTILVLVLVVIALSMHRTEQAGSADPPPRSGIYAVPYVGRFMSYPGSPDRTAAAMPVNLTVGFIADTSITEDTQALYQMMRGAGADIIVVSGDLDYINYADGWDGLITRVLGDDYPMLVASDDYAIWPEYQKKLITRWQKAGLSTCEGVPGVMHACTWKGLTIVQVTPGVFNETRGLYRNLSGIGDIDFVSFINQSFAKYPSQWKICAWHKNQHLMQTGDKADETGWGVYNECLRQGAMVMTGHEHSYERSFQMADFQTQTVRTREHPNRLTLTPTDGIVVVQGLGGRNIRPNLIPNATWWAALDNTGTNAAFSANVCIYNLNGNAKQAYCYARNINNKIVDQFYITLP